MSSDARAVFRYSGFRSFQIARFTAIVAAEMQSVAVGWQVYEMTHQPFSLGMVGLAQFLPGILLFLVSGQAADRFPRHRILTVCFAGFALCSALLWSFVLHGVSSPQPIYLTLVLMGFFRSFSGPAGQALMPTLVPKEHFPTAVAWGSSFFQAATILGPTLGGLIYGWKGNPSVVYAVSFAALAASAVVIATVRPLTPQAVRGAVTLDSIFDGFRYIRRNSLVLAAISLDLFAVLLGGAVALLPVYAREILHVGPWGLGVLRSAPGVGAVLMAVALAYYPLKRRAGAALLWSVTGFGVFTIVFGLSHNLALSLAALFLIGALDMISVIIRGTLIQLATPEHMRGRVSAVNMIFIGASNELGQFESGLTAAWFGTVPAVVLGGIGTLVVVGVWAKAFPQLRRVDALTAVHAEIPREPAITADPNE